MITKVVLKNFKRFAEETFHVGGNVVFAGQNNSGKTTLIQAIAAWHYAVRKWVASGHKERSIGIPLSEFSPVPLHEFNQLWTEKSTGYKRDEKDEGEKKTQGAPRPLVIEIYGQDGEDEWSLAMEFKYSNKDMVYVRPKPPNMKIGDGAKKVSAVHIPSFSGISPSENVLTRPYQDMLIGQGKPGDILRNLLKEVGNDEKEWEKVQGHIRDIFGYEILAPLHEERAYILCEYKRESASSNRTVSLDINTAGSGFQQILLLLAFLYARRASVLLIDEPDAHLHFNLQGEVYELLKKIAKEKNAQLIIATHSEVLIEKTEPEDIISFFGASPARLKKESGKDGRENLIRAIKNITALDLLKARDANYKILFVEADSDLNILRKMAKVLDHELHTWLSNSAYIYPLRGKDKALTRAKNHITALQAYFPKMKGFLLLDSDGDYPRDGEGDVTLSLQVAFWNRYEIENYIVHPDAIYRFLLKEKVLPLVADRAIMALKKMIALRFFEDPVNDPKGDLRSKKASEEYLPEVFKVAGVESKIPKSEYYRLAEAMKPEEFSPEVTEKLDSIARHFGLIK